MYLTILFADIANSVWLYQEQGDVRAHKTITECLDKLRAIVESENGTQLRSVGDAVLVSFGSADSACEAAIKMQRFYERSPLSIRIGFHSGEVIPDRGDVYGNAVNLAARVASFAKAGEIYTTQHTVDRLSQYYKQQADFLDRVTLKGISEPMPVSRIHWTDTSDYTGIVSSKAQNTRQTFILKLSLIVGARVITLDLDNPKLSIGRALDNDLVIEHDSTSRYHAIIEYLDGKFILKDTSTNGSYLIREGRNTSFIRREQYVLEQFGYIGVGWSPTPDDQKKISFKVSVYDSTAKTKKINLA